MNGIENLLAVARAYAEIEGVSGTQTSGPFSTRNGAENAAAAMLTRANVRKVGLRKEPV